MPQGRPKSESITIGATRIDYLIRQSDRTRARLVVLPCGSVEARVPRGTANDWIEAYLRRNRLWILRQQLYFERFRPREPARRYVAGETFRYLGRQYQLRLLKGVGSTVRLKGRHLVVTMPERDPEAIRCAIRTWYRDHAKAVFARRAPACFHKVRSKGISEQPIELRSMKRRWGSCTKQGRLLINPHLVVAPTDCVDYVLMHEICHLKYPHHDQKFYRLLTTVMPDWPRRRDRLENQGAYLSF